MHPRGSNNNSSSTASDGRTRRAFRDVTKASNNASDASPPQKRSGAVLPSRSSVPNGSENPAKSVYRQHRVEKSTIDTGVKSKVGTENGYLPRNDIVGRVLLPRRGSCGSKNSYQHSAPADDTDERDCEDPPRATDYVQDVYTHFRAKESSTVVRPGYTDNRPRINEKMRSILVDWIVEVHHNFRLVPETLYLTVNLIDRYIELKEVPRSQLQLAGVTCLLIASKYEEIHPPTLRDLVYMCDSAYSKKDILETEETVLKALEYRITVPSAHSFLTMFLKAAHADERTVQLSCYILDGTLQSRNTLLLRYLPSQLAAAAVLIARRCIGKNSLSPTLVKCANYREEEVVPVARAVLAEKGSTSTELRAVVKKYTSRRYGCVANTVLVCDF